MQRSKDWHYSDKQSGRSGLASHRSWDVTLTTLELQLNEIFVSILLFLVDFDQWIAGMFWTCPDSTFVDVYVTYMDCYFGMILGRDKCRCYDIWTLYVLVKRTCTVRRNDKDCLSEICLKRKSRKTSLPIANLLFDESSWDFVQSTTVMLMCSVQNSDGLV